MARLKVAICLESTIGGTRKHVRELALGLDSARFEVHLVVSLRRGREMLFDLPALGRLGVRVHIVPMSRAISPVDDGRSLRRLVRLFGKRRFDVVHTHSAKAGFLGRRAARVAGVPQVIHTPHVWPFQWTRGAARLVYYRLERLAAGWCDRLVCVGPGQRDYGLASRVAGNHEDKLVVVPNGVDPAALDASADRAGVRAELGVLPGDLAVGMVARLAPQKGVGRFLEAAALVARERTDVRFLLVGSGPLERRTRRRARELGLGPARLALLGHREDVPRLCSGFDVFALSSLYEGLPYVLLEAMAARRAVVATRVAGVEDVIEDGVTGRLAPPGDAPAIAEAISGLLGDSGARRDLGSAARRRVEAAFPLERFIDAHARLYEGADLAS
ncbi:MAG: glycosyltransferase family 4 protein [Planctomycetota bacterium]|jgi:glycosyltransferase involved in cell wall biosynthesis